MQKWLTYFDVVNMKYWTYVKMGVFGPFQKAKDFSNLVRSELIIYYNKTLWICQEIYLLSIKTLPVKLDWNKHPFHCAWIKGEFVCIGCSATDTEMIYFVLTFSYCVICKRFLLFWMPFLSIWSESDWLYLWWNGRWLRLARLPVRWSYTLSKFVLFQNCFSFNIARWFEVSNFETMKWFIFFLVLDFSSRLFYLPFFSTLVSGT